MNCKKLKKFMATRSGSKREGSGIQPGSISASARAPQVTQTKSLQSKKDSSSRAFAVAAAALDGIGSSFMGISVFENPAGALRGLGMWLGKCRLGGEMG